MKRKMFLGLVLGLLLSGCGWVIRPVEVTARVVEISQAGEEGLVTATMSIEQVDDKYPGGVSVGAEGMFKKHIKTILTPRNFRDSTLVTNWSWSVGRPGSTN